MKERFIMEGRRVDEFLHVGMNGYLLCFNLNDPKSLENVRRWMAFVQRTAPLWVKIILVGTKSDLPWKVNMRKVDEIVQEFQLEYFECSSKDDVGVKEVFEKLVDTIMAWPDLEGRLFFGKKLPVPR